jgi:hypothetical protein
MDHQDIIMWCKVVANLQANTGTVNLAHVNIKKLNELKSLIHKIYSFASIILRLFSQRCTDFETD